MTVLIYWAAVLSLELLVLGIKMQLFDRRVNFNAMRLARIGRTDPLRLPKAPPEALTAVTKRQEQLIVVSDLFSWLLLLAVMGTATLMPIVPRQLQLGPLALDFDRVYATIDSPLFGWLVLACFVLLLELELAPFFHQSVGRLRARGFLSQALKIALATSAALVVIILPPELATVRRFLLANYFFCGGLTLYREMRRRARTGDDFRHSLVDGLNVSVQLLILFNLIAILLTVPVMLLLWAGQLLSDREPLAASLEFLAFVWTIVSVAYFALYQVRLVLGARGFSWIDPPSWRVGLPHARYHFELGGFFLWLIALVGLLSLASWLVAAPGLRAAALVLIGLVFLLSLLYGFRPSGARGLAWLRPANWPAALARAGGAGFSPPLADLVRVAYLRALFPRAADNRALVRAVERAALIEPLAGQPGGSLSFAIIGDPGEGDDSQLYPGDSQRGDAKKKVRKSIEAPSPTTPERLPAQFAIISSDVIYPGGEIFDYERAFYRPNAPRGSQLAFYAIPGNHDWYDSLHGFLVNFTYNATIDAPPELAARLKAMPWDWRPWRWRDRARVELLRRRYEFSEVGGLAGVPATQQRLPFFEMIFEGMPLTVLGLDNGVTGSIDYVQYQWLERRLILARARPEGETHFILVLVGNPLYVDGRFDGSTEAEAPSAQPQASYSPRAIYELLRRYQVDVVMGGDTHAYQRYEVRYLDEQNVARTMHQIVNGGGGAYLSPPMDTGWVDFDLLQEHKLRLSRRGVYHPSAWGRSPEDDQRADEVILLDVFPTTRELYQKFVWGHVNDTPADSWWARTSGEFRAWFVRAALRSGFTNALNHDGAPLLQSYVRVELSQTPTGWRLQLIPYMEQDGQMQAMLDRALSLPPEPAFASGLEPAPAAAQRFVELPGAPQLDRRP